MNRHPNIAFFGGTVVIEIMVMANFANVDNAGGCSYSKSKSAQATTEQNHKSPAESQVTLSHFQPYHQAITGSQHKTLYLQSNHSLEKLKATD